MIYQVKVSQLPEKEKWVDVTKEAYDFNEYRGSDCRRIVFSYKPSTRRDVLAALQELHDDQGEGIRKVIIGCAIKTIEAL